MSFEVALALATSGGSAAAKAGKLGKLTSVLDDVGISAANRDRILRHVRNAIDEALSAASRIETEAPKGVVLNSNFLSPDKLPRVRVSPRDAAHPTLAERRLLSRGEELVEASKPSMGGSLGQRHIYNNPGHHDPTGGLNPYNPGKTVLPSNHIQLFRDAVPYRNPYTGKITYYAKDSHGNFHRFQSDGANVEFHWNGQTGGRNRAGDRTADIPVPPEVRRLLD